MSFSPHAPKLVAISAICILLAVGIVYLRTRQSCHRESQKPQELPTPSIDEKEPAQVKLAENASPIELAASVSDDNLRGLLESRLEDMEDEDDGVPKALAMVALLDEIRILFPNYRDGDATALQKLAAAMHCQLADMDAEVIDDDKWDASRQRAQDITRDLPTGAEPVITEKVASGLLFHGAVRRKQIVNLRTAA